MKLYTRWIDDIRLQLAFHDKIPSLTFVHNWFIEFFLRPTKLTDHLRELCLSKVTTEVNVSTVRLMIETDKKNDLPTHLDKLRAKSDFYQLNFHDSSACVVTTGLQAFMGCPGGDGSLYFKEPLFVRLCGVLMAKRQRTKSDVTQPL
ncbi:hypothetical protein EVAR_100412_1 [Eumeta japonica]|uniref:Uncharacterized protein n=1 Tax=Eumeta variegata TaxID=151549 RepID=A0A4C1ZQE4_EUMVA|nr:hypothetical protein EVAR_100412_1 [Eumeta japonica]